MPSQENLTDVSYLDNQNREILKHQEASKIGKLVFDFKKKVNSF